MPSARLSRVVALIVIGVTAAIYCAHASSFRLSEPDEARYAEVAREMLDTGNWVTPQLNYRPFLDKPPLLYWLTAAGFRVFGVSEGVARLPVMLAALAGLLVTFLIAQSMYGPTTAAVATVVLATSPLYFGMGQVLTMDMLLTLCTTIALGAFWQGFERRDRRWYRVGYLAVAFGMLAKGPITAVLVGIPVLALLVWCRNARELRRLVDPLGILLGAAIVLPWHIAVEVRNPGFLRTFIVHDHLQRFFSPWEHAHPFWFYAYVLPVALFPMGLLWLLEPGRLHLPLRRRHSPQTILLMAWAGVTVLIFSASRSKLIPYVLPALPALAILLARSYVWAWSEEATRLVRRASVVLGAGGLALAIAPIILPLVLHHPRVPLLTPYFAVLSVLLLATAWLSRRSLRFGRPSIAFCTLAAGAFAMLLVVEHGRVLARDYASLGTAVAARSVDDLVVFGHYLPSLGFYARKRVVVLGRDQVDELGERWTSARPLLVVASRRNLDLLADVFGAPPTVIAQQNGKVLIANEVRTGRRVGSRNCAGLLAPNASPYGS